MALLACLFLVTSFFGQAQQKFLPPPDAAKELFASRPKPRVSLSPDARFLMIVERHRFRRIEDLAAKVVALAGVRINPLNNGPAQPDYYVSLQLKDVTGRKHILKLPAGPRRFSLPVWSPDSRQFAIMQYNRSEVSLWVGDARTRQIRQMRGVKLNAAMGRAFQWLPDSRDLL